MSCVESAGCLMSSLLGVLCRVCWVSYVESAGCLVSSLLGVLCRVCWVSYVESAGCLMSSLLGVLSLLRVLSLLGVLYNFSFWPRVLWVLVVEKSSLFVIDAM